MEERSSIFRNSRMWALQRMQSELRDSRPPSARLSKIRRRRPEQAARRMPAMAKALLSTRVTKSWARRISPTTMVFRHGWQRMRVQTWISRLVTREARVTTSIRCSLESDSAWVNEREENCHEESSYVSGFSKPACIPEWLFDGDSGERV